MLHFIVLTFYSKRLVLFWKLTEEYIVTKYICFSDFALKKVKQQNFLNYVDLSFDERFMKYHHFSLHSSETVVKK